MYSTFAWQLGELKEEVRRKSPRFHLTMIIKCMELGAGELDERHEPASRLAPFFSTPIGDVDAILPMWWARGSKIYQVTGCVSLRFVSDHRCSQILTCLIMCARVRLALRYCTLWRERKHTKKKMEEGKEAGDRRIDSFRMQWRIPFLTSYLWD
jgi:hypothetical protein